MTQQRFTYEKVSEGQCKELQSTHVGGQNWAERDGADVGGIADGKGLSEIVSIL